MADASGTTIWRWDQGEPFDDSGANEDPDVNSIAFRFPQRFPEQHYDVEALLHAFVLIGIQFFASRSRKSIPTSQHE